MEAADVMDRDMEYLYADGEFWHFMLTDGSYEQYAAPESAMTDAAKWLRGNERHGHIMEQCTINGQPTHFVELQITRDRSWCQGRHC
ncbi:MAG: hypothetical protein R3E95_20430 [Thiolinea sp.]